jgi:transcriptional regulator with XRE-family HTH domain
MTTERDILEGKVLPELQAIALSMGVQGYQRLRKRDLIEAIIAKAHGVEFTPSSSPSARVQRQRLVGMELRRLRAESGRTLEQVANALEFSSSTLSRIENGMIGVRTSDLRNLMDIYEVSDTQRDDLLQIVRPRRRLRQRGSDDYIYSRTLNLLLEQVGQDETREVLTFLSGNHHRPPHELRAAIHQRFGQEVSDTILALQELSSSLIEFLLVGGQRLNLDLFSPATQPMTAALERSTRVLLADGKYDKARAALHRIVDLDPGLGHDLTREFGFLLAPLTTGNAQDLRELKWFTGVWSLLAANNDFPLRRADRAQKDIRTKWPQQDLTAKKQRATSSDRPRLPAEQAGQLLEESTLSLLKTFFSISAQDQNMLLTKLRLQLRGNQFGHDLEFDCSTAANQYVRCHVECKNYARPISPKDVADKLLQQELHSHDTPLDHWILITPYASPSNDLNAMIEQWKERHRYPFTIQIWSPDIQVEELFGLDAGVYRSLYGHPGPLDLPPEQWSDERRREIRARWQSRIAPYVRLETSWIEYLSNPESFVVSNEDPKHFGDLFGHHVDLGSTDAKGMPLDGTLSDTVRRWLSEPDRPSLLLLGDFGEGKSFFTYALSRKLAQEFKRDPAGGWVPLRLALRDLRQQPNGRGLLKHRLSEVGVTVSSWRSLVSKHNALVVLDGFDEMSVKLDPDTLTGNIRKLVDCYEEFQGCKVLITSRTRVFENARDQARLLDRIGSPQTILIAQISRRRRLEYLDEFAVQVGAREQLLELRRLYDPIGLAAKPLFLQMIKDTLQDLPSQDFNEIILYETYIRKSLRRKAADLDDDDLLILREELLENLLVILERIAVTLHISGNDFAYLRDFGDPSVGRNLAELLWRISDTAANTTRSRSARDDATARVGVRSLLKFVPAPDPDRWPVDFFHRSMREFFVARAIVRDLSGFDKSAGAREPLAASPLPPEIVNFAVGLMREQEKGDDPPPFATELLGLAKGAVRGGRCRSVGGNALSLLYALRRSLPKSDFSGLDLDFADLNGADLGGMQFAGSSMRYANLDNANLENADFSDTDITGVRLEETARVDAVTVSNSGDTIIAAYGDGTIREWTIQPTGAAGCRTLIEGLDRRAEHIVQLPWGDIVSLGDNWLLAFSPSQDGWKERARFRIKTEFRFPRVRADIVTLLQEDANRSVRMLVVNPESTLVQHSFVSGGYSPCDTVGDLCSVVPYGSKGFLVLQTPRGAARKEHYLRFSDISALAIRVGSISREIYIATGHRDGFLRLWSLGKSVKVGELHPAWEQRVHDGVVTSLAFLGNESVVSGGTDRAICLVPIDSATTLDRREGQFQRLHLTVRCTGMRIDGLQGEREYLLLQSRATQEKFDSGAKPNRRRGSRR